MRPIDADALKKEHRMADRCEDCERNSRDCRYVYGYTLMDICSMLDDAPTIGGWISTKDGLPSRNKVYLITLKTPEGSPQVMEAYLDYGGAWWRGKVSLISEYVTHWMPLPEPPEEGEQV